MNSKLLFGWMLIIAVCLFSSCETDFVPEDIEAVDNLVVEGHIEYGPNAVLPYVILTSAVPFFSELSTEQFESLFVKNALVFVNDGEKDVQFSEVCINDLPEDLREEVAMDLGLDADILNVDICIYVDILQQIVVEPNRDYNLTIKVNDSELKSTTTIPEYIPLDSLWFQDVPGEPSDTLLALWSRIDDPADQDDYYRYFTGDKGEPLVIPFQSVTDDIFFNGQEFDFPLSKAEPRGGDFDPNTFGFFNIQDTVIVKWCTIDVEHFDFWTTLEFALNSQGPFSSYTRVKTNIEGGLGIWGGYACDEYELIVRK